MSDVAKADSPSSHWDAFTIRMSTVDCPLWTVHKKISFARAFLLIIWKLNGFGTTGEFNRIFNFCENLNLFNFDLTIMILQKEPYIFTIFNSSAL